MELCTRIHAPSGIKTLGVNQGDSMESMKSSAVMHEGPEAFTRFRQALKAVLKVPKSAMPPSPFKKSPAKKTKS